MASRRSAPPRAVPNRCILPGVNNWYMQRRRVPSRFGITADSRAERRNAAQFVPGRRAAWPEWPAWLACAARLLGTLTLMSVVACAGMEGARGYASDTAKTRVVREESGAERPAAAARAAPAASGASGASGASARDAVPLGMENGSAGSADASPAERLRVYSAELSISVARVDQARMSVIEIAENAGGYVQSSTERHVTLRVPAARFQDVLSRVEALGRVRARSVTTTDVTDQYADLERRIQIAERSRARLQELLKQTEDADERVAVLREIRRLTEQIERLRAALSSLSNLIAYSRIDVELVPRISDISDRRAAIPFPWIASLDPLVASTRPARRKIAASLPADYATFSTGKLVRAEAADGTRVRIGATENQPAGDTEFWSEALALHLGPLYSDVREKNAGEFRGALFRSGGSGSFSYLVMIRAEGDELIVAEVFFPDSAAEESRIDSVLASIEEAGR